MDRPRARKVRSRAELLRRYKAGERSFYGAEINDGADLSGQDLQKLVILNQIIPTLILPAQTYAARFSWTPISRTLPLWAPTLAEPALANRLSDTQTSAGRY
jgi:hypothetical protein